MVIGHPHGRRALAWATALLLLAAVVACTSDDSQPPRRTTVEKMWTATGIEPVSAVENIAGVAIVYGTTPAGVLLYGLDPTTGQQLWSRPALPLVSVDHLWVVEVADAVTYLRPTGTQRVSQLVIADPRSGADLTVSDDRYWASFAAECADDDRWACASSYTQSASGRWLQEPFRIERSSGRTVPAPDAPENTPDGADEIPVVDLFYSYPAEDVDDQGADDQGADEQRKMMIGRAEAKVPVWSKPATDIFGPDMPSPNYFWYDDPDGGDRTTFTAIARGTDKRLDLAKDLSSASISLSDGSVAWTRPGTWAGCGLQPALTRDREAAAGEPDTYLCRYTGAADREANSPWSRFVTSGVTVTMDRINSETGAVSWSRDLGDAKALAADVTGGDTALLTDDELFVPNSTGGVVLNLQTGDTRPPAPEDIFWCPDQRSFPLPEPYFDESTPITAADRIGVVQPCRADGQAAPLPTASIPSDVGEVFDGDLRVVALPDTVVGLAVPGAADLETAASSSALASATTAPPAPADAIDPIDAIDTVETAWTAGGFAAKTTPEIIGGTAVLYGTVGTELFLIGLDPATGAERWRRPASAASIPPGVTVRVVDIDGLVAYLRTGDPAMPALTQIVLIDPATGADSMVSENRWWIELPEVCADDSTSLCATANAIQLDNSVARSDFRISRSSGAVTPIPGGVPTGTPAPPWTTLWDDLVEVTGAPTETVGIVTDDQLAWSAPLTDLFGSGATLRHGWSASKDDSAKEVLQLSAVVNWAGDGNTFPSLDLATMLVTVGIDRRNGTVLWRESGTSSQCRLRLPDVWLISTPGSPEPALRCRYAGRLDSSPPGRSYGLTVPSDLSVTVERVDLQTGKTLWSVPVGAAAGLVVNVSGPPPPLADDHHLLAGGLVVDLDDGSSRVPEPGETFWCFGPQAFEQPVRWLGADGSVRTDRSAEGEVFPCGSSGNPSAQVPASVPLAVSTVTGDGLRLVATPSGVVAFRVPR